MALGDAWLIEALVAISKQGGSDVEFATLTETVDIDQGDKDFDVIVNLSGGRITKFTPEEPTTTTLEAYPLDAGTDSGTTGQGFFDLLQDFDASEPQDISATRTRNKLRQAIMWTDDTAVTNAAATQASGKRAIRFVGADGYVISAKPSFTDQILKWTVQYKVAPFDAANAANMKWQSSDTSTTLDALAAYTSSVKF